MAQAGVVALARRPPAGVIVLVAFLALAAIVATGAAAQCTATYCRLPGAPTLYADLGPADNGRGITVPLGAVVAVTLPAEPVSATGSILTTRLVPFASPKSAIPNVLVGSADGRVFAPGYVVTSKVFRAAQPGTTLITSTACATFLDDCMAFRAAVTVLDRPTT